MIIDTKVLCSVRHKNEIKECMCGEMPFIKTEGKGWTIYCEKCNRQYSGENLPEILWKWNLVKR